jgi:hypothetical protein
MKGGKSIMKKRIFAMFVASAMIFGFAFALPQSAAANTLLFSTTFAENPNWRNQLANTDFGQPGPGGQANAVTIGTGGGPRGMLCGFGAATAGNGSRVIGPDLTGNVAFEFDVKFNAVEQNDLAVSFAVLTLDGRRADMPDRDWRHERDEVELARSGYVDTVFRIYRNAEGLFWATGLPGFDMPGTGGFAEGGIKESGQIALSDSIIGDWLNIRVEFALGASTVGFEVKTAAGAVLFTQANIALDPAYNKIEVFSVLNHRTGVADGLSFANLNVYQATLSIGVATGGGTTGGDQVTGDTAAYTVALLLGGLLAAAFVVRKRVKA